MAQMMPGEGRQPSVDEYLTRIEPQAHPGATSDSGAARDEQPPASLDEALAQRAAQPPPVDHPAIWRQHNQEQSAKAWAVVDDFLGREPEPFHSVETVVVTEHRDWLRRTRRTFEPTVLGLGWWICASSKTMPNSSSNDVWSHHTVMLLDTGDLVTGTTYQKFRTSFPSRYPEDWEIVVSEPRIIKRGATIDTLKMTSFNLKLEKLPAILAAYL
ncbi:hypothetical protein [Actinoplanes sp. DH11]|uniref:hypothetical protein n=1 Tax=Actinoplanes sp. DH11 TaxID=2857011 RepID=UPI001E5FAA56|nr:hypothetical protein [Actinoplanes sp. DH11]